MFNFGPRTNSTILTILAFFGFFLSGFTCAYTLSAQAPTKLFDIRNGGPTSTTIEYKDAASKSAVIDTFADLFNYTSKVPNPAFDSTKPENPTTNPSTIDNPQSKQQFFNRHLTTYLRSHIQEARTRAEQRKVTVPVDDLP